MYNQDTAVYDAGPIASSSKGTIAVDMDDVLCFAAEIVVHNDNFGVQPPLTIDDFKNYLYWKNRGWGTPSETVDMVAKLYAQGLYMNAPPVKGAKEGLLKLKEMGYNLIIITARSEKQREGTEDWIAIHLPDIFDEIHFTGAFQHLEPTAEEQEGHVAKRAVVSHRKRSKAEIVHSTSSLFLIDDSAENAYDASQATPPVKVLLFGDYPWNAIVHQQLHHQSHGQQHHSGVNRNNDLEDELSIPQPDGDWTYVQLEQNGWLEKMDEKRDKLINESWLPHGVERVANWEKVIDWVRKYEEQRGAA